MTYRNYRFFAFSEDQLLQDNGNSIGIGDRFVLPDRANYQIDVKDNDSRLSGDCGDNALDSSQYAMINEHSMGSRNIYAEKVFTLCGSDGRYYYLAEIEIEDYHAPGRGDDFFTFVGNVPPAGVTLYVAGSQNVSGHGISYAHFMDSATPQPQNRAPEFDNLPDDGILTIDENATSVININTSDADGDAVTYSIVGGADGDAFEIDQQTGQLSFVQAPDFENPEDGGRNNVYDVTVRADDGNGGVTVRTLWVKVEDVDDTENDTCIVIEAETMHLSGFVNRYGNNASDGGLVKLAQVGGSGDISTTFSADAGSYDLSVFVQDENDGQSEITIKVNGVAVATATLDGDNNGRGSDHRGFSEIVFDNITLNPGDTVSIAAQGDGHEFVRIDKIELCQDGSTCPDGFTLLDFEDFDAGTVVSDQFDGVTITAQRDRNNTDANDAMLFDSENPTGGDSDLSFTGQGNILIVSEDNDSSDPDDAIGGTITFDFEAPSDLHDIKIFDVEEAGGTITLILASGESRVIPIPASGDNTEQTILLSAENVTRMQIDLVGSGAVDDLCWSPGTDPGTASLGGRLFVDSDDDEQDNGNGDETGIAGQIVTLQDADGNEVATTTTGPDGSYLFEDLDAGDYSVVFPTETDDGKVLVGQDVGGDDSIDSDADPATGATGPITVNIGDAIRDVDAGVADPGTASLGGVVFMDANDNDVDDAEMGVAGVPVTLLDADGNEVATTTTGPDGSYLFEDLDAGDYSVVFPTETDDGKVLVGQDVGGDDTIDSDADPATGATGPITVNIGDDIRDVDAGVEDPGTASLCGVFFIDADRSDTESAGDGVVPNATVQLLLGGVVVATTTTAADGSYLFEDLDAGDYTVVFTNPTDQVFVTPDQGGDDTIDSDATDNGNGTATTQPVTVNIGDAIRNVDTGVADPGTASIGDTVFIDANGNGSFDDGEATLAGVNVSLLDENGAQIAATTTDANGNYLFDELDAGTYRVLFEEADGFDFSSANTGDDATDSDADPATGQTGPIVLDIGEADLTVDAGFVAENVAPVAVADTGMVCALETTNIDVLANDTDADGGVISLATVNGVILAAGESITLESGAVVTLTAAGTLDYDSTNAVIDGVAAADMLIGDTFEDSFAYTISDGQGGTADGLATVEVKGALNTVDTISATLPAEAVTVQGGFAVGLGYSSTINGTGDDRLDGLRIESAYCIERDEKFIANIDVDMNLYGGTEGAIADEAFTNNLVENLDAINWLLNQNFTEQSNGDTSGPTAGRNYTEAEIQHAIWGLTDGNAEFKLDTFVQGFYNGTQENVDELLARALAEGNGFEAGEGDLMTIILDPEEVQVGFSEEDDYDQAFIVTVAFDDLMQDCIC